jgi:hypothetical protein
MFTEADAAAVVYRYPRQLAIARWLFITKRFTAVDLVELCSELAVCICSLCVCVSDVLWRYAGSWE